MWATEKPAGPRDFERCITKSLLPNKGLLHINNCVLRNSLIDKEHEEDRRRRAIVNYQMINEVQMIWRRKAMIAFSISKGRKSSRYFYFRVRCRLFCGVPCMLRHLADYWK